MSAIPITSSFQLLTAIWRNTTAAPGVERDTLLAIADEWRIDSPTIRISTRLIAERTGRSRRRIMPAIKSLSEKGLIEIVGAGSSQRYRIAIPENGVARGDTTSPDRGHHVTGSGTPRHQSGDTTSPEGHDKDSPVTPCHQTGDTTSPPPVTPCPQSGDTTSPTHICTDSQDSLQDTPIPPTDNLLAMVEDDAGNKSAGVILAEIWNEVMQGQKDLRGRKMPTVTLSLRLNDERQRNARNTMKIIKGKTDLWRNACKAVLQQRWCLAGKPDMDWVADFSWTVKPKNMQRMLESYDPEASSPASAGRHTGFEDRNYNDGVSDEKPIWADWSDE